MIEQSKIENRTEISLPCVGQGGQGDQIIGLELQRSDPEKQEVE